MNQLAKPFLLSVQFHALLNLKKGENTYLKNPV